MSRFATLRIAAALITVAMLPAPAPAGEFAAALSSGPFALPAFASSVDWMVLNGTDFDQKIRVTVYRYGIGSPKQEVAPVRW